MRIIQFFLSLKAFQYSWWYWEWWQINDQGNNLTLQFVLCLKENCCMQLVVHSLKYNGNREQLGICGKSGKPKATHNILRMTQNYRMVEFGRDLNRFKENLLTAVAQGSCGVFLLIYSKVCREIAKSLLDLALGNLSQCSDVTQPKSDCWSSGNASYIPVCDHCAHSCYVEWIYSSREFILPSSVSWILNCSFW